MTKNNNSHDIKRSTAVFRRPDDRSTTSSVSSAAASWLDKRIEEERKGFVGINKGTTEADREAKEKARSAANKPGTLREPAKLRGASHISDRAPSRSGSNREEEGAITTFPPRQPARNSSKVVNNSVRSALEDLEKDVLRSMPNTSPKKNISPRSASKPSSRSTDKLQTMEEELVAKGRAKTASSGMAVVKRSAPSKLNQMEADMAAKAKAHSGATASACVTKRVNNHEADMEAKARARSKPTGATIIKRLTQFEEDVASKNKARGNPSSSVTSKRGSPSSVTSKRLHQMQEDVTAKAQARSGRSGVPSKDQDDIIAYKTGISLSEQPEDVKVVARPKGNPAEMVSKSTKAGYSPTKEGAIPQNPYAMGLRKDFDFGMDDYSDDDEEAGRLAIATAVDDYEDDDVFIPSAVEYDPDAKPPMYKNRRFRMYGIMGCILVIILLACAIGILALQEKNEAAPTYQIPTGAPTCDRCSIGIEEQLELEVGSAKLYDPSTSEYLAKEWIIFEDPMKLLPMDANLIQRFLLATFYFESHQLGDWRSCNRQEDDDDDETCSFQRIVNIYPMEYKGTPDNRWLSSMHECKWAGIYCNELNQTRVIDLPGQDIQGTFPAAVTRLPYVQTITLAWNKFRGQLPDSIGNMKHLLNFEVQYNQFTGNIPLTWSNAKNLQLINFGGNVLSGQMPTEVGYLKNIKGMFLYENMLSGTFPDEFAQVSLLTYARLQRNFMTGTLPTFLGDMRLNEFWINRNPVKGTIPSELGKLSNHMFDLRLFETELEGTIPEEIYYLSNLWRLDLYGANFTGTISSSIGKLESLSVFRIEDNYFSGSLPSELSLLSNLNVVQLEQNSFNGTVPSGICESLAPIGRLEFLQADCLIDPASGEAALTCDCCHSCCHQGWEECVVNV